MEIIAFILGGMLLFSAFILYAIHATSQKVIRAIAEQSACPFEPKKEKNSGVLGDVKIVGIDGKEKQFKEISYRQRMTPQEAALFYEKKYADRMRKLAAELPDEEAG